MENFASTHDDAEKGRPPRGEDPELHEEIKLEKSSVKSFTNLQHEKVPNHDRKPKRAGLSNHGSNNDRAPERDGPFVSECAEDASIWEQYMEQAKVSDEQLSKVLNSDLDSLLIFAGLFSAILSAFLIEVRKGLQEDLQEKTNNLLYILIQLQQNANDTPIAQPSPFRPTASTLQINTFWFLSLILSLMSALGASLAKGWVMQYASTTPGVSASDACSRHRRFIGITRWHLQMIVQSLPILLHIAFFLFSVGLIVLLRDDDMEISHLVLVLVSITAFIYIGSTLLPLFWSDCPFRTPVSILLGRLLSKLLPPRHNSASDLLKSQALSWMLLNSADDTVTLRITRAIAGLPAVPDIQDVLYNSQAASLLLRGFSKHPKESLNNLSPFHQESPLMVYLHAILRLLQTRRIDPYVTPNLQDIGRLGGLLDVYTKGFREEDGILQLLTCVRARILLLLGDDNLKPASEDLLFNTRIPILLKSCRPEAFGTHLLSEVYVLSHPELSKEGNLLDMVRNDNLVIRREGHEKLLKEAKRVAMEVDRISAFGIPKLLKGLTSNSLYVRRYYAQKLRDITTNYAIFREILTRYITFEELSDLVQCEDDSIQENAINVIWILASDTVIRQRFFTSATSNGLHQLIERAKKPTQITIFTILGTLLAEEHVRAGLSMPVLVTTVIRKVRDQDEDLRNTASDFFVSMGQYEDLLTELVTPEVIFAVTHILDDERRQPDPAIQLISRLAKQDRIRAQLATPDIVCATVDGLTGTPSQLEASIELLSQLVVYKDLRGLLVSSDLFKAAVERLKGAEYMRKMAMTLIVDLAKDGGVRTEFITLELITIILKDLTDSSEAIRKDIIKIVNELARYEDVRTKLMAPEIAAIITNNLKHKAPSDEKGNMKNSSKASVDIHAIDLLGRLIIYSELRDKLVTVEMTAFIMGKLTNESGFVRKSAFDFIKNLVTFERGNSSGRLTILETVDTLNSYLNHQNYQTRSLAAILIVDMAKNDYIRTNLITPEMVATIAGGLLNWDDEIKVTAANFIEEIARYDDSRARLMTVEAIADIANLNDNGHIGIAAIRLIRQLVTYDDLCIKFSLPKLAVFLASILNHWGEEERAAALDLLVTFMKNDTFRLQAITLEVLSTICGHLNERWSRFDQPPVSKAKKWARDAAIQLIVQLAEHDDICTRFTTPEVVTIAARTLSDWNFDGRRTAIKIIGDLVNHDDFRAKLASSNVLNAIHPVLSSTEGDMRWVAFQFIVIVAEYDDLRSYFVTSRTMNSLCGGLDHHEPSIQSITVEFMSLMAKHNDFCNQFISPEIITVFVNMLSSDYWVLGDYAMRLIGELAKHDNFRPKVATLDIITTVVDSLGNGAVRGEDVVVDFLDEIAKHDDYRTQLGTSEVLSAFIKNLTDESHSSQHSSLMMAINHLLKYDDLRAGFASPEVLNIIIDKGGAQMAYFLSILAEDEKLCVAVATPEIVTTLFRNVPGGSKDTRMAVARAMIGFTKHASPRAMVATTQTTLTIADQLGFWSAEDAADFMIEIAKHDDSRANSITFEVLVRIINNLDNRYSPRETQVVINLLSELAAYDDLQIQFMSPTVVTAVNKALVRPGKTQFILDLLQKIIKYGDLCAHFTTREMIIRITGFLNHMDGGLQLIARELLTDLAMIDPIPVVITVAVHNLGDEDLLVRQNSVTILLDFASQEKLRAKVATVDNMVTIDRWLRHTNPDSRLGALTVLEGLSKYEDTRDGIVKSGVVETIIDLIQDLTFGDSELPAQSVLNLGIATVTSPYFTRLISLFGSPDPRVILMSMPILLNMANQGFCTGKHTVEIWSKIVYMLRKPGTGGSAVQALKAFARHESAFREIVYDTAIVPTLLGMLEKEDSDEGVWHIGMEGLLILNKL